jgi:nucleotide-binding universal stress UspA family protein
VNFDNILFPVDFSASCIALKGEVEAIAKRFNSHVTLFHVFEIPPAWYGIGDTCALSGEWINEMVGEAQKRLDSFALDLPAHKITRVSEYGQPAAQICQFVNDHPINLIAMATHGHGAVEGLIMGSVTAKVLHNVNVPVWLHPEKAPKTNWSGRFKILCGVDFDDEAVPMLLYAQQMADSFGATVTLVHSVPESEVRPNKYFDAEFFSALVGLAKEGVAKLQARAQTNLPVKVSGLPMSQALADAATQDKANLILIGRGHSQKFLGRFRTHTYDLLGQLTCPLLSVSQMPIDLPAANRKIAVSA